MNRLSFGFLALLSTGLLTVPGAAWGAWWNNDWSYRKELILDGGPQGGNLQAELLQVPVLIRLHDGVFRFTDANPDGSDLRFVASDDKTPVKYYIEKYDSVFNIAVIWLAIPRLSPGEPVKLWMYYGNAKAANESDSRALYDAAQALVYHFADRTQPGADVTAYANHAASLVPVEDDGLIGNAASFGGTEALTLPPAATLAMTAGMNRTVMFWLKLAPDQTAVIFQQGDATAGLTLGVDQGIPYVTVALPDAERQTASAEAPLTENWHHLAVVASATATTLYVDGQPGPVLPVGLPASTAAAVVSPGPIGVAGTAPNAASTPVAIAGLTGLLDILSVANVDRTPEFIRLSVQNQGGADKLATFGVDEALSTWESGYFAIILKSVTLDGWVVIVILAVMFVISFIVMWQKMRQIGRVARANNAFLHLFQRSGGDFVALRNLLAAEAAARDPAVDRLRKVARAAPLGHIFSAGVEELSERLREEGGAGHLSAESIEAIRASLDASIVTENQALNNQMVLLTIAISGGPFLGLLGTVVGVMITFAAIAASGDVNINSIAPGIAAALVATVAGLAVAIPALFGYNYLTTRINETSARMQVFLDAFITRMAENHNRPRELRAMGAEG